MPKKNKEVEEEYHPLCHRCEHRARYLDARGQKYRPRPRYECGTRSASVGCYMYRPVSPVVTAVNAGDLRPVAGGTLFRAREHGKRVAVCYMWVMGSRKEVVRVVVPEGYELVKRKKTV